MIEQDYTQPFCIIGSKGKFADCYQDYLPPIDLGKKAPPIKVTDEVTTIFTGRYSELPAIGRMERRLKEVEQKLFNLDKKGWGGGKKDRYNEYII